MVNKLKEGLDKVFDWYLAEEADGLGTEEVQIAFDKCEEIFKQVVEDKIEISNELAFAVCNYGEERERKGFKDGFRIAFQIFNDMHIAGKEVS